MPSVRRSVEKNGLNVWNDGISICGRQVWGKKISNLAMVLGSWDNRLASQMNVMRVFSRFTFDSHQQFFSTGFHFSTELKNKGHHLRVRMKKGRWEVCRRRKKS